MRKLFITVCSLFPLLLFANISSDFEKAEKLSREGNWKDAYQLYYSIALNSDTPDEISSKALQNGVNALRNLNRIKESDEFIEKTVENHKDDWHTLYDAAQIYMNIEHYGFMIAGEFERGSHRGGGRVMNSTKRDRVKALRLYEKALTLAEKSATPNELYQLCTLFAGAVMYNRGYSDSWRLQYLTDLNTLPDYEEGGGYYYYGGGRKGAPVDENGVPVFYSLPDDFKNASNDGERWRYLLNKAATAMPERRNDIKMQFANFLRSQFSVQTMAYGSLRSAGGLFDKDESGPYAVSSLSDSETIAKLATGIKRFTLPDEFNYIKIFREIADSGDKEFAEPALDNLATIYTNRRQYVKAAEIWRESIKRFGPGIHNRKEKALQQIIGNWGRFEPLTPTAAGANATFEYRFRNADRVTFEAYKIKTDKLLDDVKAYLKSNPANLQWQNMNISNIGQRLVYGNQTQYIGEKVADWQMSLKPLKGHFDSIVSVKSPLSKAGAYLVVAKLADGNVSRIIVWLNDTVIVKKTVNDGVMFFVADARSGAPVKNVKLNLFGYNQKYVGRSISNAYSRRYDIQTTEKKVTGGDNGITVVSREFLPRGYQWLITATDDSGRFAFLGFQNIWFRRYSDREYNQTKTFVITDRPVYRPGQKVHFKFWVRHARYDRPDSSDFADRVFTVEVRNSKNEKIYEKSITADEFGGVAGELTLNKNAALGNYHIMLRNYGGGNFRVEEYKKPEYEVTVDAPSEPVTLGDKITATIHAKYYFGAPVTNAKVKYKVIRTKYSDNWYPVTPWDWMYGSGYWWFAEDYNWYPGWRKWGCISPMPWWGPVHREPPEIVMENEVEIGKDGTVKVEIDSSVAKELFGDSDHKYEIIAEVVDLSRRTVTGSGSVIAARRPFKVTAWIDRGYYRVGDTISANFAARTVDGKPVQGTGILKLYRISYNGTEKPVERKVDEWELDTDSRGLAALKIKAESAGQYRLSYTLTDKKGREVEGGYIFSICGRDKSWNASDNSFHFNNLELINDKKSYKPGDKVNLMINTEHANSTVLLFVRPVNGVYLKPEVLHLNGKSAFESIEVFKKDMPNFFVEALTVSDGKLYTVVKEIVVPPEKRILNVEVMPQSSDDVTDSEDSVQYKPGEKAKIKIRITDFFGKPVRSSAVVTMYDKAVEYISGGSNVKAIKPFFWKWRRFHSSNTISNLQRYFYNLTKRGEESMRTLGIFGGMVTNISSESDKKTDTLALSQRGGVRKMKSVRPATQSLNSLSMADEDVVMEKSAGEEVTPAAPLGGEPSSSSVTVRKNFADTAYWSSSLTPDENGIAEIEVPMPENLTTWKLKVWGMADGTKVGEGSAEVITSKNLIIRLQAPRFFVENDEVVLSAVVHNYLGSDKKAKVILNLSGNNLKLLDSSTETQEVEIPKDGEVRINWRVKAVKEGEVTIRMSALTDEESDAMEMKFPVLVHGISKQIPFTGSIPANAGSGPGVLKAQDQSDEHGKSTGLTPNSAKFAIDIPAERRVDSTTFELRYSPTLAGAMVDALPYLVSYPYGCTEQTLNRFLPTVITRAVLKDMGLKLADIRDKRTNLNAQEIGDDKERAAQWKKRALIAGYKPDGTPIYTDNPVFDDKLVDDMIAKGIKRLNSMQNSDGGWGWFSGSGEYSYPHTTAVVVHGLLTSEKYGAEVPKQMLMSGVNWLKRYQSRELVKLNHAASKKEPYKIYADNLDALVLMILSEVDIWKHEDITSDISSMISYLYRDRNQLSIYGKCTLGLTLNMWIKSCKDVNLREDLKSKLDMIMKNISQYLVKDSENQTAYLNMGNNSYWWYWYGSENEAQAYYLKLLVATDPNSKTAPWLVKYLLNNRKHSTYWESTRDTAVCIEAFADYIKATGEDKPDMNIEILFDGKLVKNVKVDKSNLFSFDNKFILKGDELTSGKHTCEIRRKGSGPVYYNAYLDYFSLEDFITKAGLEIKVQRKYYKLEKVDKSEKVQGARGQVVEQKVENFVRHPIANLDTLKSGDLVEVELVVESKNDYEYIIFEDMKPAGFEPCEVRSGYNGNDMGAYVEFRDEKVCFFVRRLARGKHSLSYRMRAEIPGKFSALPTKVSAMYAPELKANSDEIKLNVED